MSVCGDKLKLCRLIYRNLLDFYANCLHLHWYYSGQSDRVRERYFYSCCYDKDVAWEEYGNVQRQYSGVKGCIATGLIFYMVGRDCKKAPDRDLRDANWGYFDEAYFELNDKNRTEEVRPTLWLYPAIACCDKLGALYDSFIEYRIPILWFKSEYGITDNKYLTGQMRLCVNFKKYANPLIHEYNYRRKRRK